MNTIIFILVLLFAFPNFIPKYKTGQHVYNKQFQQVKRITEVRLFNYHYCIYKKLNCVGNYYTRIKWFDKNHTLIEVAKDVK